MSGLATGTPTGDVWIVEVRTSFGFGTDALSADGVDAGLWTGVMGGCGLCSVLIVENEGLHAGVCGDGAAKEAWEALEVE
jgi:hypothetical protein